MSTRTEIAGLLAEHLPILADDATTEMFFAYEQMRDQRDQARRFAVAFEGEANDYITRTSHALAMVERLLDHAPEECDCGDGKTCFLHNLVDCLNGVTR